MGPLASAGGLDKPDRFGHEPTATLARLGGLQVRVDREPEESVVLSLARTQGLSVYDASYLETGAPGGDTARNLGCSTYSRGTRGGFWTHLIPIAEYHGP